MKVCMGSKPASDSWSLARHCAIATLVVGGMAIGWAGPAAAQFPNEQRSDSQKLIDELVKRLAESELKSRGVEQIATPTTTPRAAATIPSQAALQARAILADFSRDVQDLARVLDNEQRYVSGLQALTADVVTLRATAIAAFERSRNVSDPQALRITFETLDREWRLLAYRLRQVRGLSRQATQYIDRIDQLDQRLGQLLSTTPQIDTRKIYLQTAAMSADLSNLIDDINIEIESSTTKSQLLIDARNVQQQAQTMAFVINSNPEYDRVKREYEKFQEKWAPLAARLRKYNNRYIERSTLRIQEADRELAELLWIQKRIDREQILYLAESLTRHVDDFFVRAPLKLLIDLPSSDDVLPVADEFYGNFQHFIDCIHAGDSPEALVEAYRYIDDAWVRFEHVYRPIKSDKAQQVLNEIKVSIDALRSSLNVSPGFDSSTAAQLAATLENLAEHLNVDIQRWSQRNSTPNRDRMLRDSAQFLLASRNFHEQVARGSDRTALQRECRKLLEEWQIVHGHVLACQGSDQQYLQSLASRTSPTLIQLQSLLSQN